MSGEVTPVLPARLRWWAALPLAAVGGTLLYLANPGPAIWPLVFPAVLLLVASWWQQRSGVAMLAGLIGGAAFWFPHLSWLTLYLGLIPWLALSSVMTMWVVLQALLTAIATRGIAMLRPTWFGASWLESRWLERGWHRGAIAATQALAIAGVWVLREAVQGVWPYDGFGWGRVAHVLAETPLAPHVSWLGFLGLSGLVVLSLASVVTCAGAALSRPRPRRAPAVLVSLRGVWAAGIAVAVFVVLAFVPIASLEHTGTLRVAAVQGNSKSGIFDDRESGDVYADHVAGTKALLDDLEARGEGVDVIVWPENAGEFGLTQNPLRGREVALLSRRANAPIVVGSVLEDPDGTYTNSSVVWNGSGQQLPLESSRYDKRYPVPFGEYMPNRDFFHSIVPDLVDLVQLEYQRGQRDPVLPIEGPRGTFQAGLAICFDIVFDEQAVKMVGQDAGVIIAPTNNADFGRTDESVQQLQIARLRAVETGRAIVNISTVGTSAVIAPDGSDLDVLPAFKRGALVAEVPLVTGATPALTFGAWIAAAWIAIAAGAVVAGSLGLARARGARRAAARGGAAPLAEEL